MHIFAQFTGHVKAAVQTLQLNGDLPADGVNCDAITVEQPKDASHGDMATNAAMVLAKPAGKNPRAVAELLAVELNKIAEVEKVDIAGPGFINLTLSQTALTEQVKQINANGMAYGHSTVGAGEKVMVEFVSANPTGPMHVGHGRGAIVGDALCRVLERAGFDVTREYLMNDAGGQVIQLVQSVLAQYANKLRGDEIPTETAYRGEYVADLAEKLIERDGDKWLDGNFTENFVELRPFCVGAMMEIIEGDLELLGVHFDNYFSEHAMHEAGATEKCEAKLRAKGLVYEGVLAPPKGKVIEDYEEVELTLFKSSEFGDDVDRALKKSDGSWTYFGADVAYHMNKLDRGFDKLINIWGADHGGAVTRLKAALYALTGQKNVLDIVLIQMVKLMRNGEPVKMSKRAGNYVTIREVVEEVGADAVRFLFLARRADAPMDFDLAKAMEKNNENPVFYVQYGHARMCSIERQREEMGIAAADQNADLSLLTAPEEKALMQLLSRYPLEIERAATHREPHRIAFYAQDLASLFHTWYNNHRFLLEDNVPLTHARLTLLAAVQTILQDSLGLVGVNAPDKM